MPNIDDIFKAGLAGHEMAPDPTGWDKLSKKLTSKEGKVVLPWYYNPRKAMLGALAISLLSFVVGYFIAQTFIYNTPNNDLVSQSGDKAIDESEPIEIIAEKVKPFVNPNNAVFANNLLGYSNTASKKTAPAKTVDFNKNRAVVLIKNSFKNKLENIINVEALANTELTQLKGGQMALLGSKLFSKIPTFQLENELHKQLKNEFSVQSSTFNTLFFENNVVENGATIDVLYNDNYDITSKMYGLGYARKLNNRFAVVSGVNIINQQLALKGTRTAYDNGTGSNLDPQDKISETGYTQNFQAYSLQIPLAFRVQGASRVFGYHFDAGVFAQKKIFEQRTFTLSDEAFLPLANNWAKEVFNTAPQIGFYSAIGFDTYLFSNLGLRMDAIIRKRIQPRISAEGFDDDQLDYGLNLGLFYRF
ncbi:MAG: hypothetical protein ACPGLV_06225 [Bacteroidia bacterium]